MQYDILIVGGGIVGLATALQSLEQNPKLKIAVIEKENAIAKHQTGNNSGVIHSGIYYKPQSLKAQNCLRGYQMLVDFCQRENIPHDICGKIIVASDHAQIPILNNLFERGKQNGLERMRKLSLTEMREIEPHVIGLEGIWVPQTGIVDYRLVAAKYAELIKKQGGTIFLGEKVSEIRQNSEKVELITQKQTLEGKLLINCAGLYADKIAQMTMTDVPFRIVPFRGEYYKLHPSKEYLVKNLIYPVPDPNFPFLGVHYTRMARGGVEAGPNAVLAFRREGYQKTAFHLGELTETLLWSGFQKVAFKYWRTGLGEMYRSFSKTAFTKALQKLIPEVRESDLVEGGAGVRAQACDRTGGLVDDFMIFEDQKAIHVGNAPSPAATSSLSIGKILAEMALKHLER